MATIEVIERLQYHKVGKKWKTHGKTYSMTISTKDNVLYGDIVNTLKRKKQEYTSNKLYEHEVKNGQMVPVSTHYEISLYDVSTIMITDIKNIVTKYLSNSAED